MDLTQDLTFVFVFDMPDTVAASLTRYKVARDALLGLRLSLFELPADAAAAEEWVMTFSDFLAGRVPTLIRSVLISCRI